MKKIIKKIDSIAEEKVDGVKQLSLTTQILFLVGVLFGFILIYLFT